MSQVLSTQLTPPQQLTTTSGFQFSGANLNDLESSEYTLATIVVDISGSVHRFRQELENAVKTVIGSCQNSPRSENLLIRLVTFNQNVQEIHGFRVLESISLDEIDGIINPNGTTNLFDAVQSSIEATYDYGQLLCDQDYTVNGVVYVITDGGDTGSVANPTGIRDFITQQIVNEDGLESMDVILIGVGYGNCSTYLDRFKNDAQLTQFIDTTELFAKTNPESALAKLAGMISQSISTTSMSLHNGTSGPASSILLF
jgi:uncharacterized protein YegL